MTATRQEVYAAIDSERDYQDRIWRNAAGDGPNPLEVGEAILAMEDYLEQARKIWCREHKPCAQSLEFVRKVAGLAVSCMEQHGAPPRT